MDLRDLCREKRVLPEEAVRRAQPGDTVQERTRELLAISHSVFRPELAKRARELYGI